MSPGRCTAMPSAIVGAPTTCTGPPAATEAISPGTADAWTPTTRTAGSSDCTATAIPAASPPPPTGTRTVRTSGHCSMISKPSVPWPATMSGWSNGWMNTAPVRSENRSASSSASSTDDPCRITDAP